MAEACSALPVQLLPMCTGFDPRNESCVSIVKDKVGPSKCQAVGPIVVYDYDRYCCCLLHDHLPSLRSCKVFPNHQYCVSTRSFASIAVFTPSCVDSSFCINGPAMTLITEEMSAVCQMCQEMGKPLFVKMDALQLGRDGLRHCSSALCDLDTLLLAFPQVTVVWHAAGFCRIMTPASCSDHMAVLQ